VPSPVYIAELCPTCGGGCPQELLRPESASVLCVARASTADPVHRWFENRSRRAPTRTMQASV
jgi:hypothetical protein